MNKRSVAGAILGVAILLVGREHGQVSGTGKDARVLVEIDRAFSEATATKGIEGFASFIAEDMTSIVADQPIAQGKGAFVERYRAFLSTPGFAFRWTPDLGRISEDGTLGFTVGHYAATQTENGSARAAGSGKYVTIWAEQADGSWKVVFDSGVHDTKPPAS